MGVRGLKKRLARLNLLIAFGASLSKDLACGKISSHFCCVFYFTRFEEFSRDDMAA
jgi:hypothetical protein